MTKTYEARYYASVEIGQIVYACTESQLFPESVSLGYGIVKDSSDILTAEPGEILLVINYFKRCYGDAWLLVLRHKTQRMHSISRHDVDPYWHEK